MVEKRSDADGSGKAGSGSAPGDPFKDNSSQRLAESIDDANLLVWYASKRGIGGIEKSTIQVMNSAKAKLESDWTAEEEAHFWDNYRMLAAAIAPVSVESIKASYGMGSDNKTSARKAIRMYSAFTLIVLFGLIILQAYWFIGTSMTRDVEDIRAEIQETEVSTRLLSEKVNMTLAESAELEDELERLKQTANPDTALQAKIAEVEADWKTSQLRVSEMVAAIDAAAKALALNQNKLAGNYVMLNVWDFYSEMLVANCADLEGSERNACERRALSSAPDPAAGPDTKAGGEAADAAEEAAKAAAGGRYERWLLAAKTVLAIFNQYLLPLLYGLLGSLAYILRTLTREIREVTYTLGSNVGYRLRWPLGMLAGVTIGWFFDPNTIQGAASITPLGLAFLAGYSVELLFAGLDRIVGAFTEPQAQSKGQG